MASYFRKEEKNPVIFLSPKLLMKIYVLEQLTEKLNSREQHVQITN